MTRALLLVNRLVPALSATVVVVVGGWQLAQQLPQGGESAPLTVAEVALPAIPAHPVAWPSRNVFAADGIAWTLASTPPGQGGAAPASAGKVSGVVALPGGPKGVMIDKRFVAIGDAVAGGRLKDVRNGAYVIEIDGVEHAHPLDAGRGDRIGTLLKKRER